MAKALLISALFLASLATSASGALAQTSDTAAQPAPAKKGPLGGLLEPWDGKGDDITPKTIKLGGIFEPSRASDDNRPKEETSATEPAAKKKGPLSGLFQPWGDKSNDKPTAAAGADESAVKKTGGLLQSWDGAKSTAVAKADEPAAKKAGWFSGLKLQPWHESSVHSAKPKPAKTEGMAETPASPQTSNISAPGLRLQRWDEKDDSSSGN